MSQRLRASRQLLKEGQDIIVKLFEEKSISKTIEKLQELYQQSYQFDNRDYQIETYIKCKRLEGKDFDEISNFIQSLFPSFDYQHCSQTNPTHRPNAGLTADMAALITATRNELELEEDLLHNPQKLWKLYENCLKQTSKNDLFSTDFPEHPKGEPYPISVEQLRWEINSDSETTDLTEIKLLAKLDLEEVIREKTYDDGSFKVQLPKQKLEEVYISLRRPGYKPILKKPTNLLVDPNKPRTFYLEPDEGQPNSFSEYTPTATIKTKKEVYAEGEPIEVEYFGLPGKYKDSIVLTDASTSEKDWHRYIDNHKNVGTKGNITFDGIRPGNYEIRAYYNYRSGSYFRLIGRHSIEVK